MNTPWYNLTMGLAMLIGRFLFMIPLLADRPAVWRPRRKSPVTSGTFPTHGPLFVGLLVGTVVLIAALDLLPGALAGADRRALPDACGQAVLLHARLRMFEQRSLELSIWLPPASP